MHYLGLMGAPRRYHEMGEAGFVSPSADMLNVFITVTALVVGVVQFLFLFNLVWSLFKGREASGNPWRAPTLEWQTPERSEGGRVGNEGGRTGRSRWSPYLEKKKKKQVK